MTEASISGAFCRLIHGVHQQLAECLRISAVYLGIAVIVTVGTGFILPGLRGQALQAHKAVLAALVPPPSTHAALQGDAAGEAGFPAADMPSAVAMAIPAAYASTTAGLPGLTGQALAPAPVARSSAALELPDVQFEALRNYIARKYKVAYDATEALVAITYRAATEQQLDPLLVLAVIAIESRYNPLAESSVGAQGLMQVMSRVHQDKFEDLAVTGKAESNPLDPAANIYVGSRILRDCIDRRGSIDGGLNCYVGSSNPEDNGYGLRVQAERRRLALASGVALARD
jgi:hypothetical protein